MLKEMKAPRYESPFHEAIVNLSFTHNWCTDKVKQAVAPYDITSQQFNVLRILRFEFPNPSTINLLKSKMMDKMCDASRIVERLMQKNLVVKETNSIDKRAVDILISDKGMLLLQEIEGQVDLSGILSQHITIAEAELLNQLLDKVRGLAK